MKNTYLTAKLTSLRRITIHIFTTLAKSSDSKFYFNQDDKKSILLKNIKHVSTPGNHLFEVELPFDYPFGSSCQICVPYFNLCKTIDLSNATTFPEFDELFNYDGGDLGAVYSKERTSFALWAPLAESVFLKIENSKKEFDYYPMKRTDRGVYRISLKGNFLNRKYHYVVNNYGMTRESNDPFGKGTNKDSAYSAVVDYRSVKHKTKIKPASEFNKYTEAVIYEMHVRDFTENKHSNIVNKGKYLGLTEEGRKTNKGNPAGLDYLKMLGITHVQLQPIHDFAGSDSANNGKEYNWGYDPISYFAIEGSFSLKPDVPQARLEEFRKVVDTFHKNNIRVNVDVVYNHMFDAINTSFEKCVPGYFFRRRPNGLLSNGSGCGNDFASEKFMARKAIIESVSHLFGTFDIDGLRFDLMGLIDIDTIKEIENIAKSYKKDVMLYGEGWNMGNELPFEMKACSENADKIPNYAFFNDSFRDIIKGSTFDLNTKGFICGDYSYAYGFEFAFLGSTVNRCFPKRFDDACQSLNFIECHDNHTLYDKLLVSNADDDKDLILERIKLANALTVLSFGIPFIHMGQEVGKSKFGLGNTYNVPLINSLDYKEVDERIAMAKSLSDIISIRNNELSFLKEISKWNEVNRVFDFETIESNEGKLLRLSLKKDIAFKCRYKSVIMFINVNTNAIHYELEEYHKILFFKGAKVNRDDLNVINGMIAPCSITILVQEND